MKQYQTEYSENSVTYWPSYTAGRIGIVLLLVIGILFIITSVWTLLDNPSKETQLEIQVAFPIVVIALCAIFRIIYRTMHVKIVISNTGIGYYKNNVVAEQQILWKDISAVYFNQEHWYGRKTCKIFLTKTSSLTPCKKDKCDFVLPVCSVDEQKLVQLIPAYLWKNNPWYSY